MRVNTVNHLFPDRHAYLPRLGMSLVEVIVVLAILGVLTGIGSAAVMRAREAANRAKCRDNLRQIGIAFHSYHATHAAFPPGTTSPAAKSTFHFMGWGVRLLPYVGETALWNQSVQAFSQEPGFKRNPPHVGMETLMPIYTCPSDSRMKTLGGVGGVTFAFTAYLGVEGTDQFRRDGVLFADSHVRASDISDGLSSTLLVGERPPSADGHLGWWYAGWGQNKDGSAEMVLGAREQCTYGIYRECFGETYTFQRGDIHSRCDAFHFWSLHPGGANFLFADGSVRFISYAADSILPALATRAGGEVLPTSLVE